MKFNYNTISRKKLFNIVLLTIILIVCLLYSPKILVLLTAVYLTYAYLDRRLMTEYIQSRLLLVVIAIFTYVGALSLSIMVLSAVAGFMLIIPVALSLCMIAGLYTYEVIHNGGKPQTRKLIQVSDVHAIAVTILVVCAVSIIPLHNTNAFHIRSNVLVLVTGNVDFSPHIGMFNDYLDFGTVRPWEHSSEVRSALGGFYPSGWHAANAVIAKSILPSLKPGLLSVAIFALLHIFWISVIVYLSVRLSYLVYTQIEKHPKNQIMSHLAIDLGMLVASYFFIINLARLGYFSYVPQLISALLLIYTLQQIYKYGLGKNSTLSLAVLYCTLSLATWILLLPVLVITVLAALTSVKFNKAIKLDLPVVRTEIAYHWPLYIVTTCSVIAQSILIRSDKTEAAVPFIKGILLDGGVPRYDTLLYAVLLAGLVYTIKYCIKRKLKATIYEPFLILVVATMLFAILLFAIQTYLTGALHYYYYKVLLLLPTILVPIALASFALLIQSVHKINKTAGVIALFAIPVSLIMFITMDTSVVSYIHGSRVVSASVNASLATEMNTSAHTNNVTLYLVNDAIPSDIASVLSQANRPHNQCITDLRTSLVYAPIFKDAYKNLNRNQLPASCARKNVNIVIDKTHATLVDTTKISKFKVSVLPE